MKRLLINWLYAYTPQPAFTCSKLTLETLEQGVKYVQSQQERHQNDAWRRSGAFIVNFEHISHLSVSSVNFEHVTAGWDLMTAF